LRASPRTVEWDLKKVFAKLAISSRVGLHDALPTADAQAMSAWTPGHPTRACAGATAAPGSHALRMPALAVTRPETRWNITFASPSFNLVDPETVLVKDVAVPAA
jgi:hypothetical protein